MLPTCSTRDAAYRKLVCMQPKPSKDCNRVVRGAYAECFHIISITFKRTIVELLYNIVLSFFMKGYMFTVVGVVIVVIVATVLVTGMASSAYGQENMTGANDSKKGY